MAGNVNIRLGMEAGGFISSASAAAEAVRELDREIVKAQKSGDSKKVGELYFTKNKMDATASGFQRDVNSYQQSNIQQDNEKTGHGTGVV